MSDDYKIRIKNKAQHIWIRGVLLFGITSAFLSFLIEVIIGTPTVMHLISRVVIFSIGGYFWGVWSWNISKNKINAERNDSSSKKGS